MTRLLHAAIALLLVICLGPMPAWAAGGLDATFGFDGWQVVRLDVAPDFNDRAYALAVQPDGKLLAVGPVEVGAGRFGIGVVRLLQNGREDLAYGSFGSFVLIDPEAGYNLVPVAALVQPDGRLLITGTRYSGTPVAVPATPQGGPADARWFALRVEASGVGLDPSFGDAGRVLLPLPWNQSYGTAVALQSDGRIVLAGNVQGVMTFNRMAVVRLLANGSLDPSFNGGSGYFDELFATGYGHASAAAIRLVTNGAILVAGTARKTGAEQDRDMALLRLRADGTADPDFGLLPQAGRVVVDFSVPGDPSDDGADSLAYREQPAFTGLRRIIVGGSIRGGTVRQPGLALLTVSGALDTGFSGDGRMQIGGGWFDSSQTRVSALALERLDPMTLETADHILVGGSTTTLLHNACFAARVDFTGALDTGFNNGSARILNLTPDSNDICNAGLLRGDRFVLAGSNIVGMTMSGQDFLLVGLLAGGSLFRHGFE
jgi:uncharacterized delta-60 repeat protein